MNWFGIKLLSLISISLLISIGVIDSSQVYADHFLFKFGSSGYDQGQFAAITDIAVDSSGNIFVTDYGNNRVQKFDSNGRFLLQWGTLGSGNGQFEEIHAIAISSNGNVYVGDDESMRIQIFSNSGGFISEWGNESPYENNCSRRQGEFCSLLDITFDSNGNIFVADGNHDQIQKFSPGGDFLVEWGNESEEWESTENGKFGRLTGIAVDSTGNVYAADYDNNRIQKFTNNGVFIKKWGSEGTGDNQFKWPNAIAVDSSDFVYVTDSDKIRKI